ncbi:hypothetical protein ACFFS2_16335 [Streptomyces aurantiacus]|uniref:hypothetical protein n=1 Tax=Streptomyces aurantiacus TaxID=47760 RepID=UPI001688B1CC|nr:hypothetical protein [Streptomyces aurantiacus]
MGALTVSKTRPVPTAAGSSMSLWAATGAYVPSAIVTTVSPASRAWSSASRSSTGWRGSAKHRSALAPAWRAASIRSASDDPPSSSRRTSGCTFAAK